MPRIDVARDLATQQAEHEVVRREYVRDQTHGREPGGRRIV